MKGFTKGMSASGNEATWYLYKGTTHVGACKSDPDGGVIWKCVGLSTDANGVSSVTVDSSSFVSLGNDRTLYANLAVSTSASVSASDLADKIITIDQEIV